ncbi:pleiotropic drug resistance-like protein, putative [Medicago truncatula]|uniref:Pleiotropic drug resistance-like protein, putative n=1 Tax=Medicago truncatula TaxID=3880 RepID=G7JD51_MEDTR|nr:pleiotropic drug resistance-like protein, putative [Medicago truncatula]
MSFLAPLFFFQNYPRSNPDYIIRNGVFPKKKYFKFSIIVELVANPSIIFMDEPTLGLDARAAAIVMRTVRNTVDTWRTVVCTIHQPTLLCREISTPTPGFNDLFFPTKYSQPYFMQFKACFWKRKKKYWSY